MASSIGEFLKFAVLPPEIQSMIWSEALQIPRIVQLCFKRNIDDMTGTVCHRHIPPLLQVSAESRYMAQQVFSDKHPKDWTHCFIYMQPAVDIIYYGSANLGEGLGISQLWSYPQYKTLNPEAVRTIAFEANWWLELGWDDMHVVEISYFLHLKTLILVIEEEADPERVAEFVDLTKEEQRDLNGYLRNSNLKGGADLKRLVREAFEADFEAWSIPIADVPDVQVKKMGGNILGQSLRKNENTI